MFLHVVIHNTSPFIRSAGGGHHSAPGRRAGEGGGGYHEWPFSHTNEMN